MKKKKTKKLLIILILLILFIGLLSYVVFFKKEETHIFTQKDSLVSFKLDESQTNEKEIATQKIYNPDIILPGWGEFTIKANTSDIGNNINLYNPESNVYFNCPKCKGLLNDLKCPYCEKTYEFKEVDQNLYYLKFTIKLKDSDETIYSTDLVKPGYHIKQITLNRPLQVGDYDASILIEPYKSDMATRCNVGEVNVILHVTDTI